MRGDVVVAQGLGHGCVDPALAVGDASALLHVDNWRAGLLSDLAPAGPPPGQFLPFFR